MQRLCSSPDKVEDVESEKATQTGMSTEGKGEFEVDGDDDASAEATELGTARVHRRREVSNGSPLDKAR